MSDQNNPNTSFKPNGVWPTIDSLTKARQVARQGVWASILVAVFTTIMIFVVQSLGGGEDIPPIDAWAFIDVGLFVAIAIGINKMSRFAAISGLSLYLLGRIQVWSEFGIGRGLVLSILLSLAFLNAVRATFAYHRLRRQSIKADLAASESE
ncbi:MAG: hypothetical protein AAFX78_16595 [Cyanobacteria bacterium J06638_20]